MDHSTQSSSPGESDDDPDISNATGGAERERRARVRFSSNTAIHPPAVSQAPSLPSAVVTQDRLKSHTRPILRGTSRERGARQQAQESDQAAADYAALAAQHRGHALASTVQLDSPISLRDSFDSVAYTDSGDSDYELLDSARGIALQSLSHDIYDYGEPSTDHQQSYSLSYDTLVGTPTHDEYAADFIDLFASRGTALCICG